MFKNVAKYPTIVGFLTRYNKLITKKKKTMNIIIYNIARSARSNKDGI